MPRKYALVDATAPSSDLGSIGRYMLPLMLRNVASAGFVLPTRRTPVVSQRPGASSPAGADFFAQVGVDGASGSADAAQRLVDAGRRDDAGRRVPQRPSGAQ